MTKKTKPAHDPKALVVQTESSEKMTEALAKMMLEPATQAALTAQDVFGRITADEELDLMAIVGELNEQVKKVNDGSLQRVEAALTAQAHTLDLLFNKLAKRAMKAEYMNQFESYLKLGLKAQSQCRATLETLAAIKNPQPVAFVQQANFAQNQQINNGDTSVTASHSEQIENAPNELLSAHISEDASAYIDTPTLKVR